MFNEQWQDTICQDEPLRPGTSRFGYRVIARLSGDGRAGVELGSDPVRGELAAIKHVSANAADGLSAITRLEHEHQVLQSLDHVGVRRSLGSRRERAGLRLSGAGLMLRFVDGATLDLWEAPALPEFCQTMAAVCRSLAHVHERGWVHADLRPRHVIIDDRDRPVIISFGRAVRSGVRFAAEPVSNAYAAPERLDGAVATPRADVFGLGATMAAILLRRPLSSVLPGEDLAARLARHGVWDEELATAGVHAPLRRLLMRMMHPDPLRRPAFIEAIASHLEDLADTLSRHRRLAA